jgi:DnaD/phage-associated family protein
MAVSVRTRFEVFKRDAFTCRYCGRKSPDVVLQCDHIVAVAEGGSDDPMNLATSCWECNSGKSCVPLNQVMTGEDPHDRAILILETERQLREYNEVLTAQQARIDADVKWLVDFWMEQTRRGIDGRDVNWIRQVVTEFPAAVVREAMTRAINARKTYGFGYVVAVLRNWRNENKA